ncbi:MAG: MBL fold metallo-hydrolase RNA specificity domain-containing protein [Flavobacteriales bacterium]
MNAKINIHFLGASETVTGSKFLVETGRKNILIDCGLFQGLKELRLRNWAALPVDVSKIDHVILTHGHLDHVGYLPLLLKQGFKGNIYATQPTIEIAKLILQDSAKIQEEDAVRANKYGYSKHHPAVPLYTVGEAKAVFEYFNATTVNQWIELEPAISFRFKYVGHIIGATFVELKIDNKILVFSGDIGRLEDPIMRKPEKPQQADYLFIESTYGDRNHPGDTENKLAALINKLATKKGTIIIPSFAVERAQLLMYYLWKLLREKKIPAIPVYMDSPMGTLVLEVFKNSPIWHKLSADDCNQICNDIKIIKKQEQTEALARTKTPKIIIASSGMASGGRVLTYFEHYLDDPTATIMLTGYQGEGTRGRDLLDGAKEIKMRGKWWKVRAEVVLAEGLSAHADQTELIDWMSELKNKPKQVFIIHGEKRAAMAFQKKLDEVYQMKAIIPQMNQVINLA